MRWQVISSYDFNFSHAREHTHTHTFTLTIYNSDGWPLTVQQQANVLTSKINAPVPTRMYGVTFEYSIFSSKYWCNSTCIQMPAQKIANPDAYNQQEKNGNVFRIEHEILTRWFQVKGKYVRWCRVEFQHCVHIQLKQLRFVQEAAIERENMWINDVRHEKINICCCCRRRRMWIHL